MLNKSFFLIALLSASILAAAAQTHIYVSMSGNNRNEGTKEAPLRNIQRAIDNAVDGSVIHVAEGNYFGTLDRGFIVVNKPVTIIGGYAPDFSKRDVLVHRTMIQPTPASNGTVEGQGTIQIQVRRPGVEVVIDGLIIDRGNSISYNARGEGKPEGVESPMMNAIGTAGIGGADLTTQNVQTRQITTFYLDNISCDLTIRNCAFINSPFHGIVGTVQGGKITITNNIFIGNRFSGVEINGGSATLDAEITFSYNTVLFTWSRLRDFGDMGYGFRFGNRANSYVTNNIIGLSVFSGIDRTRVDSDRNREARRVTTAEHNIFFLNKQGDLTLPGGGMFMRINVDQFEDVDQLAKVAGNKSLTDPSVFKGVINEPYLNGFLNASYQETTNVDPNSPANQLRAAMGMNIQGTMQSSATMFANRYPWQDALKFFGAIQGYGAQTIKN